jgi:serine/threonine-protein kinase
VLGALAIVIAILIVLNAQDRKARPSTPPTVTNTITQTTPFQSPAAMPGWTDQVAVGNGGLEQPGNGVTRIDAIASPAKVQVAGLATEPEGRRQTAPEQTWQ